MVKQNAMVRPILAIALGAVPGALARYVITEWIKTILGDDLSYYATALINGSGCFLIALFYTLSETRFTSLPPDYRLAIATGFCGAYTTFSTYGLETVIQLDQGNNLVAAGYWLGSMVLGMVGVQMGVWCGRLAAKPPSTN